MNWLKRFIGWGLSKMFPLRSEETLTSKKKGEEDTVSSLDPVEVVRSLRK